MNEQNNTQDISDLIDAVDSAPEVTETPVEEPKAAEIIKPFKVALSARAFVPVKDKKRHKRGHISILGGTVRDADDATKKWGGVDPDDVGQKYAEHLLAFQEAVDTGMATENYIDRLKQGRWVNEVPVAGAVRGIRPLYSDSGVSQLGDGDVAKLSGSKMISGVRRIYGEGTPIAVPLWHSGFWIWIRPAKNIEWVAQEEAREIKRSVIGRDTGGLCLSGRSAYEKEDLVNFAIQCIVKTNIENLDIGEELKGMIVVTDLPIIAWALMAADHVDGYPYRIPCHHNVGKCTHYEDVLMIPKVINVVDEEAIRPDQKQHMANPSKMTTIEAVTEYQSNFRASSAPIRIDDHTSITLQTPNARDYFNDARGWYEYSANQIRAAIGNTSPEVAEKKIMNGLTATILREYGSYITEVESVTAGGGVIRSEGVEAVRGVLELLSDRNEVVEAVQKVISEHLDSVTVNVIGYPQFKCPSCNGGHNVTDEDFPADVPAIVPMDPFKAFFTLMGQKVSILTNR